MSANVLAGATTYVTIDLMHAVSDFALESRKFELAVLPYWRALAYGVSVPLVLAYLWPIVSYFRNGTERPAPLIVQRRIMSAPLVVALIGFTPWALSPVFFFVLTLYRFGRWEPDLMSQQVLSPLVNGSLAAITIYLLIDWVFRTMVVPVVFPGGRLPDVPGAWTPGVRARLLLFLIAVAFAPLFTMLGLIRAAALRVQFHHDPADVLAKLAFASTVTFFLYIALGIGLTLVMARSLTRPLGAIADALRRVRAGDLGVAVAVDAGDEMGVLEDGVNAMVSTLRDRERILQTFGRVVEPAVRDRLLAGDLGAGGELRHASILFCDLRGFTEMAERTPPADVVATLNAFFTVLTAWVRECGGFVDKFIGDAMLVVFGLFDDTDGRGAPRGESAAAAIRCALGIRERLGALNAERMRAGVAALEVSIGMHSGEVLAGTIGAADRHEYTVIGDTVNVAARLQQTCKERGHALLVSGSAYELARACGLDAEMTAHDAVVLRGRSEPVRVYAPS
jgi:adenylate cyclase